MNEQTGPKFLTAVVLSREILAGKYHSFTFQTDTPLIYKPGQYVSIKVAENRINAYSIAGNDGPNKFMILVDTSPGGPGSIFFDNLKVGEEISYLGPFGVFTFKDEDDARELIFLGTGSGCSPLKCILDAALKEKNIQKPITLYFGLRNPSDIFWQDYFKKLSEEHPNFKFKLALSKPDEAWQGPTGHITDLVNTDFADMNGYSAYLCGNKEMIEQANNILTSKGIPKEKIYYEKF
jgi:NAD(P)H-flavin reductase